MIPVPFELRPDVPPEGISAAEYDLGHSERVEQRLIELAAKEGRTMVLPDLVPNTHKAMALAEYARDVSPEKNWELHIAIFDAYYQDGLDIGDAAVLADVAAAHGIDTADATAALHEGRFDDRLADFSHLAFHLGIDSTPSALICNELLIGSRPYGILRDAVQRCLIRPDSIEESGGGADDDD